ncbi:hypothetical protein G7Y89_g11576 [Cudoniella acicularis]|uniref:HTH psq-type domain-containing protein n=1 Tax=Cudoniella acicularis TaxID=354080 RepID=A0A8H4W003_9HELO|nr:hypothetical protein G7Y89_g11576 [Cudoniella acicularis]
MRNQYTEEDVIRALEDVANGKSIRKASLDYGVLRTTLQSRLYGHESHREAATPLQKLALLQLCKGTRALTSRGDVFARRCYINEETKLRREEGEVALKGPYIQEVCDTMDLKYHEWPFQGFFRSTKIGNETTYSLEFQLSHIPEHHS